MKQYVATSRARIERDHWRSRWSRQPPSCPTLSSYGCSSLLLTSLSMSPCTISCYIPTTSASHTTSLADSGNSPSTSFGRSGVSYGEHRCSLQTPSNSFLTPPVSAICLSPGHLDPGHSSALLWTFHTGPLT